MLQLSKNLALLKYNMISKNISWGSKQDTPQTLMEEMQKGHILKIQRLHFKERGSS